MTRSALLFFLLLSGSISFAQSKTGFIKVIEARSQDWISGASPGRAGTTYTIKVKILSNKPIAFKNLWIGGQHEEFEMQTFFRDPNKRPTEGDSVLLVCTITTPPYSTTPNTKNLPFKYHGMALVAYSAAGKTRYFTIKAFLRKETVKGE